MKERFEGEEGARRLREALKDQKVLGGDAALIDEVAAGLVLISAKAGDTLMEQGTPGGDLFFVLMGDGVEILVDNRSVAAREAGEIVGEMSAIEPAGFRS